MVSCIAAGAAGAGSRGQVAFLTLRCAHLSVQAMGNARRAVESVVQDGCGYLIVDLAYVEKVDSGGLGTLVSLVCCLGPRSEIVLANAHPSVIHALRQARIEDLFTFADTVKAAVDRCNELLRLQEALDGPYRMPEIEEELALSPASI